MEEPTVDGGQPADPPTEHRLDFDGGAPPAPPAAADMLGAALPSVARYVELLAGPGVERGLLGPREVPRIWDRHVLNCAVLEELVPPGASLVDVGSGAGLPGIVMALTRPDLRVTLVEPLLRRTRFLDECVEVLRLRDRVTVVRGRAEEVADRVSARVVTARAVAPLDRLARWCLPLAEPGGVLLAVKGRSAASEVAAAGATVRRLGGSVPEVLQVGVGTLDLPTTVVRVRAGRPLRRGRRR